LATDLPAGLSPSEGRKFGLTVGGAFLVLAGVLWWRGRPTLSIVFAGAGGALVLAGLLVPAYLGPVHSAWMGLAHLLSKVTTPIFMGVVYFVVITPVGLLKRLFGRNPMKAALANGSYWVPREADAMRGDMERQF
jgi:hypothetical protein